METPASQVVKLKQKLTFMFPKVVLKPGSGTLFLLLILWSG